VARVAGNRSGEIDWDAVPRHPVAPEIIRTLRYMQDIESHTIVYTRSLLATRAIADPEWRPSSRAGCTKRPSTGSRSRASCRPPGSLWASGSGRAQRVVPQWLEARLTAMLSRAWPDFCAVHMIWGAINELSALTAYRRLAALANHPC